MGTIQDIGKAIGTAASTAAGGWLSPVLSIIDKIIPDPQAKAEAQLAVLQLNQAGQLQEEQNQLLASKAQSDIDLAEAQSPQFFRSGWRPFVGWICGLGLGYQFLLRPLLGWLSLIEHFPDPPSLDLGTLLTLLGGLLGFGGFRTYEKTQGIS